MGLNAYSKSRKTSEKFARPREREPDLHQREEELQRAISALVRAWTRAGTPPSEQTVFLASGAGLPYAAKIVRVESALLSLYKSLIGAAREALQGLWMTLKDSEIRRLQFTAFREEITASNAERLLVLHETEVSKAHARAETSLPILR